MAQIGCNVKKKKVTFLLIIIYCIISSTFDKLYENDHLLYKLSTVSLPVLVINYIKITIYCIISHYQYLLINYLKRIIYCINPKTILSGTVGRLDRDVAETCIKFSCNLNLSTYFSLPLGHTLAHK